MDVFPVRKTLGGFLIDTLKEFILMIYLISLIIIFTDGSSIDHVFRIPIEHSPL